MKKQNYVTGWLYADMKLGRYILEGYPLHAGQTVEIEEGGKWVPRVLEMDMPRPGEKKLPHCVGVWYLVGTNYRADGLEGLHARIIERW